MRKFQVIVDGVTYDVNVEEVSEEEAAGKEISMNDIKASEIKTEESKPAEKPAAAKVASGSGTPLKTPMPGMVMGFKVSSGAAVKKGQAVVVLEAMKMENDISASADGIITFVAAKGANVNTGDILAYIK